MDGSKNTASLTPVSAGFTEAPFYRPGNNCWRVERAHRFSMVVDCANYYRILHHAVMRARRSVFVLGWDIDSRIELLRAEDKKPGMPSKFFDLVRWKAEHNPEVQFYLNRWDYTIYQAGEREGLSHLRWRLLVPRNVHFLLDNAHPVGGCHHQKVAVIDDELAFVGGMDIAIGRWDFRGHHPQNPARVDPGGTYEPRTRHAFPPHHDIMTMMTGPAARTMGELVRERWRKMAGKSAMPILFYPAPKTTPLWPEEKRVDMSEVSIAFARTLPHYKKQIAVREIEHLYLNEIAKAERFIYMENQYFTSIEIADAINLQLRLKPQLQVLMVSCDRPQGIMESKAMWGGRVRFRDHITANDVGDRVLMVYPFAREHGVGKAIRIHSKLMVVDDRFLHVGSANINNRSMRLDTECDVSIEGRNPAECRRIADIRNDLIREHSGWPAERIEQLALGQEKVDKILIYHSESTHHMCKVDDEKYRYQRFMKLATRLADPSQPPFSGPTSLLNYFFPLRWPKKR